MQPLAMEKAQQHCINLVNNISAVILGKKETAGLILAAMIAGGHVIIDDVPGVGKTILARALAISVDGIFRRIQFTPDLLPSDITGFNVFDQKRGEFNYQSGPVMSNILLADEINRAIPRTQSSLLESMEERQVTIDGATMELPRPFMVIATQNPLEMEGTFPLPEAQLDRFLMKVSLGYPQFEEECSILEHFRETNPLLSLKPVITLEQLLGLQETRKAVKVSLPTREFIVSLVRATRVSPLLHLGASPRAALHLMKAAQSIALMQGRSYILPDDVKALAAPVLAHRLILRSEETAKGVTAEAVLKEIAGEVKVPLALESQ